MTEYELRYDTDGKYVGKSLIKARAEAISVIQSHSHIVVVGIIDRATHKLVGKVRQTNAYDIVYEWSVPQFVNNKLIGYQLKNLIKNDGTVASPNIVYYFHDGLYW